MQKAVSFPVYHGDAHVCLLTKADDPSKCYFSVYKTQETGPYKYRLMTPEWDLSTEVYLTSFGDIKAKELVLQARAFADSAPRTEDEYTQLLEQVEGLRDVMYAFSHCPGSWTYDPFLFINANGNIIPTSNFEQYGVYSPAVQGKSVATSAPKLNLDDPYLTGDSDSVDQTGNALLACAIL